MRFFEVLTMFGHVGNGNYIELSLFICAANKKEASIVARWCPRVKHHNKNVIKDIKEINELEFWIGKITNSLNAYFDCKCKRDQLIKCPNILDDVIRIEKIEYQAPTHYRKKAANLEKEKEFRLFRNEWRNKYAKI